MRPAVTLIERISDIAALLTLAIGVFGSAATVAQDAVRTASATNEQVFAILRTARNVLFI